MPGEYPTIAEAVTAASSGDTVEVQGGRNCGVALTKRLVLVGREGAAIVGCASSPALASGLRVGFMLAGRPGAGSAADGAQISGFVFDRAGSEPAHPLAFGVLGRFTSKVIVTGNTFRNMVQAVTNTAGDGWVITGNRVRGLRTLSGGGVGIVVQPAAGDLAAPGGALNLLNRPEDNTIADNDVEGRIPDGLNDFSMAGILVVAADRTVVSRNHVRVPANQRAKAAGEGVLVTSKTAALEDSHVPGARETVVEENDGRASEWAVLVEHHGVTNMAGLELRANTGAVVVEELSGSASH